MKKHFLTFGAAALLLIIGTSPAFAKDNAFTKFGRGMSNILTSPGELYAQPLLMAKDNDTSVAIFGGLLKGAAMFLAREVVGVVEIATFPIPIPKGYAPIIQPATTFTDWETRQP